MGEQSLGEILSCEQIIGGKEWGKENFKKWCELWIGSSLILFEKCKKKDSDCV